MKKTRICVYLLCIALLGGVLGDKLSPIIWSPFINAIPLHHSKELQQRGEALSCAEPLPEFYSLRFSVVPENLCLRVILELREEGKPKRRFTIGENLTTHCTQSVIYYQPYYHILPLSTQNFLIIVQTPLGQAYRIWYGQPSQLFTYRFIEMRVTIGHDFQFLQMIPDWHACMLYSRSTSEERRTLSWTFPLQ